MTDQTINMLYDTWCLYATEDPDVAAELQGMKTDPKAMEDAFYKEISFGTGGLRGVIGAGTSQMNIYTVGKASQGLAHYVQKTFPQEQWKIAISYDSRIKSDRFARTAAEVFAAAGIQVCMYSELMPTPCLSFAVRQLKCAAGIMVTASHNPAKYNGYKVYGADGCQITAAAAKAIYQEIQAVDTFADVNKMDFEQAFAAGKIQYIGEEVVTAFIEEVKKQSMLTEEFGENQIDRNVAIVYSPLNGTGLKPVMRTLQECGYTNITVVKEQEHPDGRFPTCPSPNPEVRSAMELGLEYARRCQADLLLATDPDCDRVGIAVKNPSGDYVLVSGNETGMLLLDYICSQLTAQKRMPKAPVFIKSIVTTDMAERIAASYGVACRNVLTGFKYIGEQIGFLEETERSDSYLFGFEESYGYLRGDFVRDKDGVSSSLLICEMFAWYRTRGISLYERLQQLYEQYGYCLNTLHSYTFEGAAGFGKMQEIMAELRKASKAADALSIGGKKVLYCLDYIDGLDGLPSSDVLKFYLEENCSVVVRPSGTEPKLKLYFSVCGENMEAAAELEKGMAAEMKEYMR